jgi:hypothetical protein
MPYSAGRKALIGGDNNTWGAFQQGMDKLHIGANTIEAYITAGALYLSAGMMGLYDGSQDWNITNSAAAAVSVAGLTASAWASVEISAPAGVPTILLTSIGGATNPASLPATFTGAYDGTKGGFYITGTKRCHSLVWINGVGIPTIVVNTIGGADAYTDLSSTVIRNAKKTVYLTKAASYAIGDSDLDDLFLSITGGRTVTLPDATLNVNRKITIRKSDDNSWWVKLSSVAGNFYSKSGYGVANAYIRRANDSVAFVSDGINWIAENDQRCIYIDTGIINRNLWQNKHIGTVNLVHTGAALTEATIKGMKLIGVPTGSYGWITGYDSGTKTIYLRDVTSNSAAKVFQSGETLNIVDVDGAGIAIVTNSAADWINTDSDFYHGFGFAENRVAFWLEFNDGTVYNIVSLVHVYQADQRGTIGIPVDTNKITLQSGTGGAALIMHHDGTANYLDTDVGTYRFIATLV